jgi:hypothetical protein
MYHIHRSLVVSDVVLVGELLKQGSKALETAPTNHPKESIPIFVRFASG